MPARTPNAGIASRGSLLPPSPAHATGQEGAESVNALIGAFASVLQSAAGRGIRMRFGLADSVDRLGIDPTQFKMALLNVVTNAGEAMRGSGELVISTRLVDDRVRGASPPLEPGLYAAICIADSGCGISEHALDPVFEPFFSGHESGRNAGLGLSQVHGFATQSRGGVAIESTEGRGTRVTIYLPLMAPADETGAGGAVAPGTRTVLLVDDDDHVRGSTSDAIEMLGYRVIAEASAAEALERLRQQPDVDILFTDIVLPKGMSGIALARQARALRPDLRILLASGHARESLRAEAGDEMDAFAFLAKPYRLQELGAALKALVTGAC